MNKVSHKIKFLMPCKYEYTCRDLGGARKALFGKKNNMSTIIHSRLKYDFDCAIVKIS